MKSHFTISQRLTIALLSVVALGTPVWSPAQENTPTKQESNQYAKLGTDRSTPAPATAPIASSKEHYLIGNDDVLAINVWKEPDITRSLPVRSDGKISLPLIGEVQASGKTPKELEADITKGLRDFISEPEVTVIVQESKSQRFSILGQVQRPGSYLLNRPMTVLDAIAIAGGFRDFAKTKNIRILRQQADGKQVSLPFNYKDAIKGENPGQNVELEPRDTIYVP